MSHGGAYASYGIATTYYTGALLTVTYRVPAYKFDGVRVHVLVASNALYARMFATARPAQCGERELRVPAAEDLALLLTMSEDEDAVRRLAAKPDFDRALYNEKLTSIGLGAFVV